MRQRNEKILSQKTNKRKKTPKGIFFSKEKQEREVKESFLGASFPKNFPWRETEALFLLPYSFLCLLRCHHQISLKKFEIFPTVISTDKHNMYIEPLTQRSLYSKT